VELITMAWRTGRLEPARVLIPAAVIFFLAAFEGTFFTEISTDRMGLASLVGAAVFGASTLGLTFYSGMLERLVGAVERNETPQPVLHVLRTLPWFRLLLAEIVLLAADSVAGALLALPGLIIDTLFALVGPLINLLDCSVREAFRRSLHLVWPHFMIVLVMVTLPLAIEHEVIVLISALVPHERVVLVFLTNFALGFTFGVALGLVEVSLAERLVSGAHGPGRLVSLQDVELPGGASMP
jgi:hypothetical protein